MSDQQSQNNENDQPDMPAAKPMCMDKFLHSLAAETPCNCMYGPHKRFAIVLSLTVLYMAVAAYFMGCCPEPLRLALVGSLGLELLLAFALGASSLLAATYLQSPDCYNRRWVQYVPWGFAVALISVCVFRCVDVPHTHFFPHELPRCFQDAFFLCVLPIAVSIFVARRGATIMPVRLMLLQVMGVGALGWAAQRMIGDINSPHFAYFTQWIPFLAAGLLLGMLARRLYKW